VGRARRKAALELNRGAARRPRAADAAQGRAGEGPIIVDRAGEDNDYRKARGGVADLTARPEVGAGSSGGPVNRLLAYASGEIGIWTNSCSQFWRWSKSSTQAVSTALMLLPPLPQLIVSTSSSIA
jgi:hypothetical protein